MNKEIRWKQRFSNFEKAFKQLEEAVLRIDELDDLSKEGLIQRFEYTFELAWKTIKDFIESKGEDEKYTRDVIKKAFQLEIVENGEIWFEMLEKRNLMEHTYDKSILSEVVSSIHLRYFPELAKLITFLKQTDE